jgi:ERCC4 domain
LAISFGDRQTRNADRLASAAFQDVLEDEITPGQAEATQKHPSTDCSNGGRKSDLRAGSRCRRVGSEAGDSGLTANGWGVLAEPTGQPRPLIAALEQLRSQSHPIAASLRFPSRGDGRLSPVVRFQGWFSAVERRTLKLGDYSISGLEDVCVVERKDLSDLVRSFTVERSVFVARLRQMAEYPHRLLVVTAALSQVKSFYPHSAVNPNQITQSLIAMLAGLRVPFVCTETHEMGEEILASYLYQVHLLDNDVFPEMI